MGAGMVPRILTLIHCIPKANDLWSSRTTLSVAESAGMVQRNVINILQNAKIMKGHR